MQVKQKHKIIYTNLKKYYKEKDDIWDYQLIDKHITEYFIVENLNWRKKIIEDKKASKKRSLLVKTKMFWSQRKHLNYYIASNFLKSL